MQKFNIIGKPLLGEKYVEGKKKENKRRKNNGKFSGHYFRPRTHNVIRTKTFDFAHRAPLKL